MSLLAKARRKVVVARSLSTRDWADTAVAITELARARVKLMRFSATSLVSSLSSDEALSCEAQAVCNRVSAAIARSRRIVPWRSDCLVQALAARAWLDRRGIPSALSIGVKKAPAGTVDAHAWLKCGPITITGGRVEEFISLTVQKPRPTTEYVVDTEGSNIE